MNVNRHKFGMERMKFQTVSESQNKDNQILYVNNDMKQSVKYRLRLINWKNFIKLKEWEAGYCKESAKQVPIKHKKRHA